MSAAAYGLLGVVVGGLITSGVDFVRVWIERRDRLGDVHRDFVRAALVSLQDVLVTITTQTQSTLVAMHQAGPAAVHEVVLTPHHHSTLQALASMKLYGVRVGDPELMDSLVGIGRAVDNIGGRVQNGQPTLEGIKVLDAEINRTQDRIGLLLGQLSSQPTLRQRLRRREGRG